MRILITGSKGTIGSRLIKILEQKGYFVFGLDLYHTEDLYDHGLGKLNGKENYFRCDVAEYRQLEYVIDYVRPDFMFHLGSEFGRWNSLYFYEQVIRSNCIGMEHIIRLQKKYRFKLIFTSSSEVYGDTNSIMTEDLLQKEVVEQLNTYSLTKFCNEQQIKNFKVLYPELQTVVCRIFNTYSEGEYYHGFRSVNCRFAWDLLHGKQITCYKNHTRTSTYIDDACNAIANIVDNFKDQNCYNIASTTYHTIGDLCGLILKYTGADLSLVKYVDDYEILTTKHKRVDNNKSVRDLGFKETVTLDEGVRRTVEWMRKEYNL